MRRCRCFDSCLTNGYLTVPLIMKTLVSPCVSVQARILWRGVCSETKGITGVFVLFCFFSVREAAEKE